ncbi:hypothetical protein EsH8_XIII_000018 [Colletotrichum jinshuiense]
MPNRKSTGVRDSSYTFAAIVMAVADATAAAKRPAFTPADRLFGQARLKVAKLSSAGSDLHHLTFTESTESLRAGLLDDEQAAKFSAGSYVNNRYRAYHVRRWPWILSTGVLALTAAGLFIDCWRTRTTLSRYAETCAFDIGPESSVIQLEPKLFDGALSYNSTGDLDREHAPYERIWVGDPGPEMDRPWDHVELHITSTVLLQGAEADLVRDRTTLGNGYWVTGLDVFHQVHCINQVRKALYPEYYPPFQSSRAHKLHWEHCLDYVRQAVMCNADQPL